MVLDIGGKGKKLVRAEERDEEMVVKEGDMVDRKAAIWVKKFGIEGWKPRKLFSGIISPGARGAYTKNVLYKNDPNDLYICISPHLLFDPITL